MQRGVATMLRTAHASRHSQLCVMPRGIAAAEAHSPTSIKSDHTLNTQVERCKNFCSSIVVIKGFNDTKE